VLNHGAPLESGADKKTKHHEKRNHDTEAGGLCAFDYARQSWVTDQGEARALRLRQIADELQTLRSSRGEEYAQFNRKTGEEMTREQMVAGLERERNDITGGKEVTDEHTTKEAAGRSAGEAEGWAAR